MAKPQERYLIKIYIFICYTNTLANICLFFPIITIFENTFYFYFIYSSVIFWPKKKEKKNGLWARRAAAVDVIPPEFKANKRKRKSTQKWNE